jgi:hypothetical protein
MRSATTVVLASALLGLLTPADASTLTAYVSCSIVPEESNDFPPQSASSSVFGSTNVSTSCGISEPTFPSSIYANANSTASLFSLTTSTAEYFMGPEASGGYSHASTAATSDWTLITADAPRPGIMVINWSVLAWNGIDGSASATGSVGPASAYWEGGFSGSPVNNGSIFAVTLGTPLSVSLSAASDGYHDWNFGSTTDTSTAISFDVTFYEQGGVVVVPFAPVPEPTTTSLVLSASLAFAVFRMAKRWRAQP